jgi:hypothetical protein
VVGGIDDLLFGKPDGQSAGEARVPHLLWRTIDYFYEAHSRGFARSRTYA